MDVKTCKISWMSRTFMLKKLYKLREEKQYTDATISCCGSHYSVHKLVLAASSQYFEELFQQTEKLHPLVHPVIVLSDIQKSELDAILSFIYQGEVSVPEKDVARLLEVARVLKIKGLFNADLNDLCQFLCQSKKAIKSIVLSLKSHDEMSNKSMLHAHSEDSGEVNEVQQEKVKKKRKNEDCGLSVRNDKVSLAAPCYSKRRRKAVGENDDVTSETTVCINKESEAVDSDASECIVQASTRRTLEGKDKCWSTDDHSATTAICLSDSQSKDGSEAAANANKLTVHTPSEDVFISVGVGDNAEPVPGPSGYSSNNDDIEGDENEEGINFDEENEPELKIKEEKFQVNSELDSNFSETVFISGEDIEGDENEEDINSDEEEEPELKIKEENFEVDSELDSNFSETVFISGEDACVNNILKKESDDPGGRESMNFEYVSTPLTQEQEDPFVLEKDLSNSSEPQKFYKLTPNLSPDHKEKFWKQEGVQRILLSIRDHKITLKDAALLLGTTYRILYRRYSSLFGGIKQGTKDAEAIEASNQDHPRIIDPKKFQKVEFHACPHCAYKNPYKHNFLEHLKSHIDMVSSSNSSDSSKGEEPRSEEASSEKDNFVSCDVCSAKFAHMRTLRSHMQIHYNMSPLECPFCSIKFDHKTAFTAHLETHKNEKSFDCPVCKAKYAHRHSLNEHLKVHYE